MYFAGLPAKKPDFMIKKYRHQKKEKPADLSDSDSNDEEWTPRKKTKKQPKPMGR